jgi:hypothetical protein
MFFLGSRGREMNRLELDFTQATPKRGWIWLLAGLAAAGIFWLQYQDSVQARDNARSQYERKLQESGKKMRPAVIKEDAELGRVRTQLSMHWGRLLDAIEGATQGSIALLDINPDAGKGIVKLLAEARNEDAMFAYIHKLSLQPGMTQVVLQSHELQVNDPQQPIRFNLTVRWSQ